MTQHSNDIQKYLEMVRKRKFLFLAVALLVASVVCWGSFFLPKQYEAKSTVFIEHNIIKDMVKGVTVVPTSVEDKIRVLKFALLSREFVLRVLRDLDQDIKSKNDRQLDQIVTDFQKNTDITIKGNDLFFVKYRDKDPKLAMNYINTLVRKYLEENITSKKAEAFGANKFISEQVNVFKAKLDKTEEAIIKYRQQKGVYMAVDDKGLIGEIKAYQNEIEAQRIHLNELIATRNSVKRQLQGEEPFTIAALNTKKPFGAHSQIASMEGKIKRLLVSYTENYPEILKLRAEIEALKKQPASGGDYTGAEPEVSTLNPIHQDLKQKMFQAESEIEAVNAKMKQLHTMVAQKENELRNIPESKRKLGNLENERNTQQGIYEQLVMQQGKSEVSKQMEVEDKATTFRIEDPAVLPTKPVSPDRVRLILVGILAGLAAGIGAVMVRESLDTSITSTLALKSLGLEVLAVIPKITIPEVESRRKRRDRMVYAFSGLYFLVICAALLHEAMELTLIETVIAHIGIAI